MTQQTFTDNVLIDGSQDIKQLRVQGHTTQTQPLQTWEDSAGNTVAQVTGDGRVIVGDDVTPDSLIEAHRLDTSTSKPTRGFHSLGQVTGTLNALVQWIVEELELTGASAISALHTALRVRASNKSTVAGSAGAEVRGADIEVINDALANAAAFPKATGMQVTLTNAAGKVITDAIGLKVKMNNLGTITNPYAFYSEGPGVTHLEDYVEIKRPATVPGTPATDFVRVYPKTDGKLYAKNWNGTETQLGSWGYQPAAYPIGFGNSAAYATALACAANGGTALIPIVLTGHMLLDSVSIHNLDATLARAWRWDLYVDLNNASNSVTRVAQSNGSESFTAAAASQRILAASGGPIYLPPGAYWLAIQSTHASNAFTIGSVATTTFGPGLYTKTKTTTNPNGAALDIVAATWTKVANVCAVALRGRVAADTVAY